MKVANFLPSEILIALSLSGISYEFSKLPFVKYILITLDLDQALCFIMVA